MPDEYSVLVVCPHEYEFTRIQSSKPLPLIVQFLELQSVHKSVTVNIEQVEVQKREVLQLTHTIEELRFELIALKKEVRTFLSEYTIRNSVKRKSYRCAK